MFMQESTETKTNILYSILEYVPSPKVYEVCF